MLSIGTLIRKLKSPYYYNIGFVDITSGEFIKHKGFGNNKVTWLKHGYSDRWFADPFIVEADNDKIVVLAEELEYGKLGRLVRLIISRKTKELIERSLILELPTHLSYPNPIVCNGKTYIYPENSQSGRLSIYKYHDSGELEFNSYLINQPLNDSSIIRNPSDNKYYLIATDSNINVHDNTVMFSSDSIFGEWHKVYQNPIIMDSGYARPGGNFFIVGDDIYRPAQDCKGAYGNSLHIMKVDSITPWIEREAFQLRPKSFKYSKGLHTINFHKSGIAVIDGNGYAYPLAGRILGPILNLISKGIRQFL